MLFVTNCIKTLQKSNKWFTSFLLFVTNCIKTLQKSNKWCTYLMLFVTNCFKTLQKSIKWFTSFLLCVTNCIKILQRSNKWCTYFLLFVKKLQNYGRVTTGVLLFCCYPRWWPCQNSQPWGHDVQSKSLPWGYMWQSNSRGLPDPLPLELDTDRCIMTEQKDVIILLDHVVGA